MQPVITTDEIAKAFVAEGVCTAEEAESLRSGGKTHGSVALLDRISRDRDSMLRVAERLNLAGLSHLSDEMGRRQLWPVKVTRTEIPAVRETTSPEPIPVRGPDDLCPPRQRRRRERARRRALGGA